MSAPSRTVVFGFDALSARYLDAFADELPNFTELRSAGVDAPLRATIPPWTPSAWPSMYTGTGPGTHGVFDFFAYRDGYPDEASIVSRSDVDAPAIWEYLTALGHPSIVLNVPVTHPAEPIEGALIPGYLAPEDAPGHPRDIRAELESALGSYRIYSTGELSSDSDRKLDGYVDLIETRGRAAAWLLENYEWRFAFVQVQKTDAVFHNFDEPGAHGRVYRAADDLVGTVLDAAGEDVNVVVCSDHGMGPARGYKIYLNEILREHGYVESTTESTRVSLSSRKADLVGQDGSSSTAGRSERSRRAVIAVTDALSRVGVSPGDVYLAAQRLGLGDAIHRLAGPELRMEVGEGVDWAASTAYCRSKSECGVRINLAGREPAGVVQPSEYDDVRAELIDLLSSLCTPDGEPAFEFVESRESVYDGPHVEDAPDVVFLPREMNHTIATSLLGRSFVPADCFDHERDGVFVAHGPDVDATASIGRLSVVDVAPIVMASLGVPVPDRMTGRVPEDLLSVPVERDRYRDVSFGTRLDADEDTRVEERLADLGYL